MGISSTIVCSRSRTGVTVTSAVKLSLPGNSSCILLRVKVLLVRAASLMISVSSSPLMIRSIRFSPAIWVADSFSRFSAAWLANRILCPSPRTRIAVDKLPRTVSLAVSLLGLGTVVIGLLRSQRLRGLFALVNGVYWLSLQEVHQKGS